MPALTIASNDKGDQIALVDNQWVPVQQTATNDKGQTAYLINNNWVVDEPAKQGPSPMTGGRIASLTARAVSPYATAGGIGALIGAPVPVIGPALGATAGTGALALTDIATGGYNALANYMGWPRVRTGSEAIQDLYGYAEPETPGQQMYVNALEAATGAGMQAAASRVASRALTAGSTPQRVLSDLSKQPAAQVAAATTASAATDYARQQGIDDPLLLLAVGTASGVLGGGATATLERMIRNRGGRNVTIDSVRADAKAKYKEVDDSGVIFEPASYGNFLDSLEQQLTNVGFNPNAHTAVAAWINRLERSRTTGSTLTELDSVRSEAQKMLGRRNDANTRRLLAEFKDSIDDYVTNAGPGDISTGNLPQAQAALGDARRLWTSVSKAEKIEELLRRASLQEGSQSQAIRNEFRSMALNQRQMRQFSPVEREFIEQVARGRPFIKALEWFGERTQQAGGLMAAGGAAAGAVNFMPGIDPTTGLLLGGGMMLGGAGMKGAANALTRGQAQGVQQMALGRRPQIRTPRNALLSPAMQAALANSTMDPALAAALGLPQG